MKCLKKKKHKLGEVNTVSYLLKLDLQARQIEVC